MDPSADTVEEGPSVVGDSEAAESAQGLSLHIQGLDGFVIITRGSEKI